MGMGQGQDVSIAAHFAALDDPRVERTKHHSLIAILTIALCATICGADGWVEVEEFGKAKRAWLSTFLELPQGIPSHDTFGRVFAALDPDRVAACFRGWVAGVHAATGIEAEVIAIDGKEARRSHDRGAGKAVLRLVSAWATGARLVLAQRAVADKASELGALPEVLGLLALEGCIVTIDAMGGHATIARAIVDGGGDYVRALKGNQKRLFADAQALVADARAVGFAGVAHDDHRAVDGGHGRVEIREAWAITDPAHLAYLDPKGAWPELRALGVVRAERRVGARPARRRATTSPAWTDPPRRGRSTGPCAATGTSRTACTGSWTSPSARTSAACARAMPPTISPCCATSRSPCSAASAPPASASRPSASRPAGTTATSSRSSTGWAPPRDFRCDCPGHTVGLPRS